MAEWCSNNIVIITIIGWILAVAGIFCSIYFGIKSIHKKDPKYFIRGINILDRTVKKFEKVNITYDNNTIIDSLTVSEFKFYNYGDLSIKDSDIPNKKSLSINAVKENIILEHSVVYKSRDTMIVETLLSDDRKSLFFSFNYINPKSFFILRILHTGNSPENIKFKGELIGINHISSFKTSNKYEFIGISLTSIGATLLLSNILKFNFISLIISIILLAFSYAVAYLKVKQDRQFNNMI